MRKVTFGVANSLDNFIARADHGVDWLLWTDEVAALMKAFWTTIDTVVMGRKTNIHPVLLGSGIPLFHPMTRQIDLELAECRVLQNGCVCVTYRVKR